MAGIVYTPAASPAQPPVAPVAGVGTPFSPQTFRDRDEQYKDLLAQALGTRTTGWLDGLAKVATAGFLGYQKSKNQERADTERSRAGADVSKLLDALTGGKSAPASAPAGDKLTNALVTSRGGTDTLGDGKLPADMVAKESGGKQFASNGQPLTSPAGAIGVAQVMPGTAPEAARLAGVPFDENRYRTDPAYNEQLGAAYYDAQMQKYGDPELARAAYNAGPGRTDQYVNTGRPLPAETVAYADLNGDGRIGGAVGTNTLAGGVTSQNGPAVMPVGAGDMPLNPNGPEMPQSMQSGYPSAAAPVAGATPDNSSSLGAALAILSNPWADEGQKQVAGVILQQAMKQGTPTDDIREYQFARAQGFPGSFQDWMLANRRAGATTLNLNSPSNQEAIRTADQSLVGTKSALQALDRAMELNDKAASGMGAGVEQFFNRAFDPQAAAATTELNNVVIQTALDQLRAIFGGNPTEGERNILLQMQGAGNLTRAERSAVFTRARQAVMNRMNLAEAQSRDLRTGDYYKPGYEPPLPSTAPAGPQGAAAPVQGGGSVDYKSKYGLQ